MNERPLPPPCPFTWRATVDGVEVARGHSCVRHSHHPADHLCHCGATHEVKP